MRNSRRVLAALAVAAWAVLAPLAAQAQCVANHADIQIGETQLRFSVEVADTPEERAQGLMFRESLPRFGGMLFVYEEPQPVSFWMKNTLIPLDLLFFDEAGTLVHVHENAIPGDLSPIPGNGDIQFVLEINGGAAAELGLRPGAEIRHEALDQDVAAWPCAE